MTQNGDEDSLAAEKAEKQVEQLDRILDEYEDRIGIKRPEYNKEVDEYLELTKTKMTLMSYEECVQARYLLEQYSFHLLKILNKEKSRAEWCKTNIDIIYARDAKQYKGASWQSWEETRGLVIAGNTYAQKLNQIWIKARNRIVRLDGLPEKISFMSKALYSLEQCKRGFGERQRTDS